MNAVSEKQEKRIHGRLILVFMFVLFLLPFVSAALWYTLLQTGVVQVEKSTNHGTLIQPPESLNTQNWSYFSGESAQNVQLQGLWTVLFPLYQSCSPDCQKSLWLLHQIRIALGTNRDRLQRIVLLFPAYDRHENSGEWLNQQYLLRLQTDTSYSDKPWSRLDEQCATSQPIYLIDPRGDVMMCWSSEMDPGNILEDIKQLMKSSSIG